MMGASKRRRAGRVERQAGGRKMMWRWACKLLGIWGMHFDETRGARRRMAAWRGWAGFLLFWAAVAVAVAGATEGEEAAGGRIRELRREIARHDELYFKKAAPVISDFEYDKLKAELRGLEARAGAERADTVGDDRTGKSATWRHVVPMLSLEKAYSDEEVAAFEARVAARLGRAGEETEYRVEPKYDGVAISLTYERGRLVRATTRGDGAEGDDITAAALAVRGVARSLRADPAVPWPERVELRGEVYLRFAEFERVNAERTAAGEGVFANPRNLAAGSIRLLDTEEATGRGLEFVGFGWGGWEPAETRPATLGEFGARLEAWGLMGAAQAKVARGRDELIAATAALREAGRRGGFPTDGVVVKLERAADQETLGNGPSAPRWALARKFAPERAAAALRAITWQVGRTGVLTPVAELEPIELDGSTVTRATLHNADEIARRDLRPGDRVFVEKAGEIIPAVVGVDLATRAAGGVAYAPPENCPSCAAALARVEGRAALRCGNEACPARLARRIEHLVAEGALDVAGLGPGLIEALVERGAVSSPAQVFRLREEDLRGVPGVGAKSAERVLAALAEARRRAERDGARLLFGLGWPGVGKEAARRLAVKFDGLEALAAAEAGALRSAAGLGAATVETLAAYLASPEGRAERAAWAELGIGKSWSRSDGERAAGPLAGQVVALTGTLKRWTRDEATQRLAGAGAEVAAGVTRRTTLVVAGEEAGGKLEKARALGIEVIDEAELARRLGRP
jgi:DNA ligase (NAD+)